MTSSICISPDYVALRFFSLQPDSAAAALAVRRALRSRGYAPWPDTEADIFTAGGQTLIIARPGKKFSANTVSAT